MLLRRTFRACGHRGSGTAEEVRHIVGRRCGRWPTTQRRRTLRTPARGTARALMLGHRIMAVFPESIEQRKPSAEKPGVLVRTGARLVGMAAILLAAAGPDIHAAEHGLPEKAVEIARPFGFPITNSMVVTWIVAIGLIVFAQIATRKMTEVPGSAQNFLEWLVQSL